MIQLEVKTLIQILCPSLNGDPKYIIRVSMSWVFDPGPLSLEITFNPSAHKQRASKKRIFVPPGISSLVHFERNILWYQKTPFLFT
jgi:hypothetical protein